MPRAGSSARPRTQIANASHTPAATSSAMGPFASIETPSHAPAAATRATDRRVAPSQIATSAALTKSSWKRSVARPRESTNGNAKLRNTKAAGRAHCGSAQRRAAR